MKPFVFFLICLVFVLPLRWEHTIVRSISQDFSNKKKNVLPPLHLHGPSSPSSLQPRSHSSQARSPSADPMADDGDKHRADDGDNGGKPSWRPQKTSAGRRAQQERRKARLGEEALSVTEDKRKREKAAKDVAWEKEVVRWEAWKAGASARRQSKREKERAATSSVVGDEAVVEEEGTFTEGASSRGDFTIPNGAPASA